MRLDIPLVNRLGGERMFDHNVSLAPAAVHVTFGELDTCGDVGQGVLGAVNILGAQVFMQDWRTFSHRLVNIDDMRQDLVVDLDQGQSLPGNGFGGGGNRRNRMTIIQGFFSGHDVAGHIP